MINFKKDYKNMNWNELTSEGRKRGLDKHSFSFKGVEGAGERDRIEIIRQLNLLDQQKDSRDTKLIALISLVISAIALVITLITI